ncbi:alpha/beta hydrolase [Mesorhizobium sp. GbtcB19]|uniref:alpha/beta hydrolase n=1 Tax=Mesorhizobium sp. GbtcB19 TaxID=2824764 RepID=UPI001C2F7656|nr:alpha/beta hydrolase [Mesorhizobium sp. GbtcB19]
MDSQRVSSTVIAGFPAIETGPVAGRPPLLFVHGAFVDHTSFRPWLEFFAEHGWRGFAAARRGRAGIGPARAKGLAIADYVEDTLKVIAALGEKPVVIGHSLGGLIAQQIAALGHAEAIVLLCPAPAAKLPAQKVALPTYLPMMPRILTGQPILPSARGCATIALNRMPKEACPVLHAQLVPESGKVYRELIFGSYKVDFAKISCPAMVVGAAEDRIVAPALVEWTAQKLGVTADIRERHAHWLLEEPGWEEIAAGVADFLTTHWPARQASLSRTA